MKNPLKKIAASLGIVASVLLTAAPALAFTGTTSTAARSVSCTPASGPADLDVDCSLDVSTNVGMTWTLFYSLTDSYGSGVTTGETLTGFGDAFDTVTLTDDDTYYFYAECTGGLCGVGEYTSSFTVTVAGGGGGTFSGTLAAGISDKIGEFGTEYGPVVLAVIVIALGLYGLKFAYAWFTIFVKTRGDTGNYIWEGKKVSAFTYRRKKFDRDGNRRDGRDDE